METVLDTSKTVYASTISTVFLRKVAARCTRIRSPGWERPTISTVPKAPVGIFKENLQDELLHVVKIEKNDP